MQAHMSLPGVVFQYPGKSSVGRARSSSLSAVLSGLYRSCRNLPCQSGVGFRVSPVGFSTLPLPCPYPPPTVPLSAAPCPAPYHSASLPSPASQLATFHTQPWSSMTKEGDICLLTRSGVPTLQTSNLQKLGTGNTHTTGGKFHP